LASVCTPPVDYIEKVQATVPVPAPIEKIGFFHFGDTDKSDPVGSLVCEMGQATAPSQDFKNALIVLPEALNILGDYKTRGDPDPSVLDRLKEVSRNLEIVFVVGLIVERRNRRRYSYACLIDGDICRILSCKTDCDWSHNYRPHRVFDQPVLHRGVCIAALICHDAAERTPAGEFEPKTRRHAMLVHRIQARRDGAPLLLCIPARMNALSSEAVAEHWMSQLKNCAVIVANGTPAYPSIIHFGGAPVRSERHGNAVCLCSRKDPI
jgi:predicted amidohydrolase